MKAHYTNHMGVKGAEGGKGVQGPYNYCNFIT